MAMLVPDKPVPALSMQEMQPFNIPTEARPAVRTGPRMQLEFPVFKPPEASSYGSTMPMKVPWEPPNLVGAIQGGLELGGKLATDYMQNRKTAQEIQAEEAVGKQAIAAMHDPNRQQYVGYEAGPGGFTAKVMSPFEAMTAQATLAKTGAETEEARARTQQATAEAGKTTTLTPAEQQKATAEAQLAAAKARWEGMNGFQRRLSGLESGFVQNPPAGQTGQTATDQDQNTSAVPGISTM